MREAVARLASLSTVLRVSTFAETDPVGYLDQPRFVNAACLLKTDFSPEDLMQALLAVELAMGRVRDGVPAKGPRVIDLDLIFYGGCVMETELVTVPHPAMSERRFVLEPLAEIAPDWMHPVTGMSVREMLAGLPIP